MEIIYLERIYRLLYWVFNGETSTDINGIYNGIYVGEWKGKRMKK